MLGATALALLTGFWRPRTWLTVAAIIVIVGGAAAGAVAIGVHETIIPWIAAIAAALGFAAIRVSVLIRRVNQRMRENRRVIDALTQIDSATGSSARTRAGSGCARR
jgi:hypothetical protein